VEEQFHVYGILSIENLKNHVYNPHIRTMESADSANHVTVFSMPKTCI